MFSLELIAIENFRFTDRNKAGGDAVLEHNELRAKAEFIFYLQGMECLSIRLGRHDPRLKTAEIEEFIQNKRLELKKMVKPDVERIRKERRLQIYGVEEF